MRCLLCKRFSFFHICQSCQKLFLTPQIYKRKLPNSIEVLSFYKYDEIKPLLLTKHTDLGYHIFHILAKNSFLVFGKNFYWNSNIASINVENKIVETYSHTAILNYYLKSKYIHPYYYNLLVSNDITYSSQSREYRKTHPREFIFSSFREKEVIIVDDIITTGSTLQQACSVLENNNKEVLFCLTLADASKNI